jgi:uncharacterized protein
MTSTAISPKPVTADHASHRDGGTAPHTRAAGSALPDPADPLVLDTRGLGRRPGAMLPVRLVVPAPAGLTIGIAGVPDGDDLDLDLRLEAVMEGVLASGTVHAPVLAECARCLDEVSSALEAELCQLYSYEREQPARRSDDEEETETLYGDLVDLRAAVRDAVVLELPSTPLCRPDCPGLCSTCGARLADVDEAHAHPRPDPRWAALADALPGSTGTERASGQRTEDKET